MSCSLGAPWNDTECNLLLVAHMVSPLGTHRYCYHAWALRKFPPDRGIWMTGEEAAGLQKEHYLAECMASWESGGLDICLILLRHLLSFGYALDTTDSLTGTSNAEDCLLDAASRTLDGTSTSTGRSSALFSTQFIPSSKIHLFLRSASGSFSR
jgi:hypothetical protein